MRIVRSSRNKIEETHIVSFSCNYLSSDLNCSALINDGKISFMPSTIKVASLLWQAQKPRDEISRKIVLIFEQHNVKVIIENNEFNIQNYNTAAHNRINSFLQSIVLTIKECFNSTKYPDEIIELKEYFDKMHKLESFI